jgi:hypothetical protein
MMAILAIIYLVALGFLFKSKKKGVIVVVLINLLLCVAMLIHHATDVLNLRL